MATKILMIEDEPGLIVTVGDRLEAEGYIFESSTNGIDGEEKALTGNYDLIILDVMLPGKDGFYICKSIRSSGLLVPILMLTALGQVADKVLGLKMGADDYLAKPFDMSELLARIEALLRRAEASAQAIDTYQKKPGSNLSIDLKRGFIITDDKEYSLSAQEIKLLDYFYRHEDTIISREELLNTVWGYDSDITTRTIDVHVARLRQKMGDVKDVSKYIHTIRGIGYKFTRP
ncbi:response regulator transcription factor [Brucepastera parasyntrophica]|uniref:response regulator transcription factor n=1 Tax=Brucepastera parasyntrophica TaxID=2880008 RepID=UPI002108EF8E|nr:response regulator transcription factor [Brucepastera parasyntrophica]ULQ59351.1 response regulator transcription factor [Brucepastera parasyntrophica]